MKSARTHRARRRPHGLLLLICATLSLSLSGGVASAFWTSGSMTRGNAMATAATVGAGQQPSVSASGKTVTVAWTIPSGGAPVTDYLIKRYDETGLSATGCLVPITLLTCTDSGVPEGTWRYSVTPQVGGEWMGSESKLSAVVIVDVTAPTVGAFTDLMTNHLAGTIKMTLGAVSDAGSGISTVQLWRSTASFAGGGLGKPGSCGTFGVPNIVQTVSPFTDSSIRYGHCYLYQYIVIDRAGNKTTVESVPIQWIEYEQAVSETTGLLSHWRLGDKNASTLIDSAGRRPGSYSNTALEVGGAVARNTAATFNGNKSNARIPGGGVSTIRSVELWFRASTQNEQTIFRSGSSQLQLTLDEAGALFKLNQQAFATRPSLETDKWHHVTLTLEGDTATLYINGTKAGEQTLTGSAKGSLKNQEEFAIGTDATGSPSQRSNFIGSIDEVSVYNTVLSCSTIRAHYAFGNASTTEFTSPCAP